jgi:N-acyl-L-homoserine lactone synthetase
MKDIRITQPVSCISYEIAESAEMISEAKHLCHDVYLQMGYIEKPFPGRVIPNEYDPTSIYIVALNSRREVVGTIRLILEQPFDTLAVWKQQLYFSCGNLINDALNGNSFEIGALAVRKDHSSMKISWGLYKTAFTCAKALELDYAVITMDARALRSLEMLGWYVVKIGKPMLYFGSLTVPGIMPVKAQEVAVQSKNQTYYKLLAA